MEASELMIDLLNGAALAYVGDAIYEIKIREHVIKKGKTQAHTLHKAAVKYVEASSQAFVMKKWIADDTTLTPQEIDIYKRGRNHKANTKAKNASIADYRQATGFEALLGWLHLTHQHERLAVLVQQAIQHIEENEEH